jgi:hypothetical protein
MTHDVYATEINGRLARHVLDPRRAKESALALPDQQREWVTSKAQTIIDEIESLGVAVIGSLDELRPEERWEPYVAPEELPVDDLLAAAIDALAGYTAEHAARGSGASKNRVEAQGKRAERRSAKAAQKNKPRGN